MTVVNLFARKPNHIDYTLFVSEAFVLELWNFFPLISVKREGCLAGVNAHLGIGIEAVGVPVLSSWWLVRYNFRMAAVENGRDGSLMSGSGYCEVQSSLLAL
jgi:hypothetical protein